MASNKCFGSYTEIYDLSTQVGKSTILAVHTPKTNRPQMYMNGFFRQFKKFKYLGASMNFVPASTLPADPLQLSYEAGEPTIDPRDMVNPILFKHWHGESLGDWLDSVLDGQVNLSGTSLDRSEMSDDVFGKNYEQLYYQCLTDKTFKKAGVQSGFRMDGLYPLAYALGSSKQSIGTLSDTMLTDPFTESGIGDAWGVKKLGSGTGSYAEITPGVNYTAKANTDGQVVWSLGSGFHMFTYKRAPLGWMETLQNSVYATGTDLNKVGTATTDAIQTTKWATLPKLNMALIMLPPAYKQEMYFRVVIKHRFAFAGFRSTANIMASADIQPNDFNPWQGETTAPQPASLELLNASAVLTTDGVS